MFTETPKVFMSKVQVVVFGDKTPKEGYINLFNISAILPVNGNSQCSYISLLGGREILVIGSPVELTKRFIREGNGEREIDEDEREGE